MTYPPSGPAPDSQPGNPGGYGPPPGYAPPPGAAQPAYPAPGGYPSAPPPPVGNYDPSALGLPQGVEMASRGRRVGAAFLAIPLVIVTLGIGYIIWGLILWGRGTSPALKVLGMKVYHIDQRQVPGFGRMALRNVVGGIVQGILGALTEIASFICFLATGRRQTLPDLIAGTTVIYDPQKVMSR